MKFPALKLSKGTKLPAYGKQLRPARDGLVLLAAMGALLIASIGWNLWKFRDITRGPEGIEPTLETTRIPELDRTKAIFESRKTEEERYLTEYRFVDPSR